MAETTTTATATPAPSGQTSYVQSLLSPALDGDEGAPSGSEAQTDSSSIPPGTAPEGSESPEEGETQEATQAETPQTVEDLIREFALESGLNPEDPSQRKTLKRLADKELFIRKLQADNRALLSGGANGQPAAAADSGLVTDFEKELMQGEAPAQPAAAAPAPPVPAAPQAPSQAPSQPSAPPSYGDVGDAWKTPEDSLTALNDAWGKNDLKTVHEIEVARMKRNFDAAIAPSLLNYVRQMIARELEGSLGDVIPEARRSAAQRSVGESREFAVDQLRKAGAADIDALFEAQDGPPIRFGDQEFPNTPLNRILAKHPEILQISGTHSDPKKREQQAFIARYKLAYQIMKQGAAGIPAETAKALVNAGREIKAGQANDRARQAINAGSGPTGVGDKAAPKSYIGQLNSLPGEIPFSSLLS